jgi:alginate O-acetyltransferase complex protein AlgI
MVFSSLSYIVFLALSIILIAVLPTNGWKKAVLLIGSYWFYSHWDPRFVLLLGGLTVVTHLFCVQMMRTDDLAKRRRWLTASLVVSLGTLAYFKYLNFFIGSVNGVFNAHVGLLSVVLPVGISFIVFEVISYAIDVFRGDTEVADSFWDFALLVAFFPHLVAGPILKPKQFLPQTKIPIRVTWAGLNAGGQQFLVGLIKKTLVADRVAPVVNDVFAHPLVFSSATVWMGVLAYAIQIYCDFSGYTDMAIGSARCLGFDLPPNFNLPYLSRNITDFWRRWHISLSTWLREYLYIPLGGNRKGRTRQYINLFMVMLLGGLWHGASWNFVIWGGLHGVGLAIHKLCMDRKIGLPIPARFAEALSVLVTFLFVITLWVPFRAPTWEITEAVLSRMYVPSGPATLWLPAALAIAIPLLVLADWLAVRVRQGRLLDVTRFPGQLALSLILLALLYLAPKESAPFIYFQF